MTDEQQDAARKRLRKLASDRRKAATAESAAIVTALRAGVRQVDIARDIERSREHVRQIARQAEADGKLPADRA